MSKSFVTLSPGSQLGFWAPDLDHEVFMRSVLEVVETNKATGSLFPPEVVEQYRWMNHGVVGWMDLALDRYSEPQLKALVEALPRVIDASLWSGWTERYLRQRVGKYCQCLSALISGKLRPDERFCFLEWLEENPVHKN